MNSLLTIACAVCGAGEDPAKGSYVGMTLIISALPLAMLGGIIWYVVRAAKKAELAETAQQAKTDGRA